MSQAFDDTIYLFACGARGYEPVLTHDIDVVKIFNLAVSQGIWQTTFMAIKNLYKQGRLAIDEKTFVQWNNEVAVNLIHVTQKNRAVSRAMQALEQNGIQCCLLKGEILATLYYHPISRVSNDTDLLIEKKLIKKAVHILKQCGFEVIPEEKPSYHVCCNHPQAGLIELHHRLYDEIFEDVWFDKMSLNREAYRQLKTSQGNYITTLGINDGLIFVTLHLIKHFLYEGVGIRQLMDVLLYMSYYKDEIDWGRYDNLLAYLKYDKFIRNAIGIGVKYLGFAEAELPQSQYDNVIMQKILLDMENGGLYGKNEVERKEFYKVYTEERFKRFKQGSYKNYMYERMKPQVFKALFPARGRLLINYPYARNNQLLLLVAWLHRLLNFFWGLFNKEKAIKEYIGYQSPVLSNEVIKKRMDIIRELDMV
ncbi:hypothetical protein SPSYN_00835 [Sporotomaculum syntrophicum]|uniref:Nucleotidyltransferase n=1 Tax=Sporotomaculum syntrophicum TaxID=182264 RepID=A0A9D3AYH8_9FIRM|nr:nucleotidyltransferase family protein [Sporotomaculum syntrophicum]KAF1086097.1 hypothetical protein SPSYN_00835 [Sporotomaculum syntrophicum]